jgi:hypothetical protein
MGLTSISFCFVLYVRQSRNLWINVFPELRRSWGKYLGKPKGRGFKTRWCEWSLPPPVYLMVPALLGPEVYSASIMSTRSRIITFLESRARPVFRDYNLTARVCRSGNPGNVAQWLSRSIRESWGVLWLIIRWERLYCIPLHTCQHAGALTATTRTSPTPRQRTVTSKYSTCTASCQPFV